MHPGKQQLLVILITIVFSASTHVGQHRTQEMTFNFNPPDGLVYYQTQITRKTTIMGASEKRTDITESKSKIEVKKTSTGYLITVTPSSAKMTRNGVEVNNPILLLLQNLSIVYEVDEQGQLVSIKGFEKLREMMKASFPPQVVEQLSSLLNEEALVNKETSEWNGRIGDFAGAQISVGDVFTGVSEFPLPGDESVTYYTVTKFEEIVPCGNRNCIKISFYYNSNPETLEEYVGDAIEDIARSAGKADGNFSLSKVEITGEGERLMDPATMLIYSELIKRNVRMEMEVPGQGKVPVTQIEERQYIFEY